MRKPKHAPTLRYQTQYFYLRAPHRPPDAYGHGADLTNATRNAAGRCAVDLYSKAVIVDRWSGHIVRVLKRDAHGLSIDSREVTP